jgi:hypothetical protein
MLSGVLERLATAGYAPALSLALLLFQHNYCDLPIQGHISKDLDGELERGKAETDRARRNSCPGYKYCY